MDRSQTAAWYHARLTDCGFDASVQIRAVDLARVLDRSRAQVHQWSLSGDLMPAAKGPRIALYDHDAVVKFLHATPSIMQPRRTHGGTNGGKWRPSSTTP